MGVRKEEDTWQEMEQAAAVREQRLGQAIIAAKISGLLFAGGILGGLVVHKVDGPNRERIGEQRGIEIGRQAAAEEVAESTINTRLQLESCQLMDGYKREFPGYFEDFKFESCVGAIAVSGGDGRQGG